MEAGTTAEAGIRERPLWAMLALVAALGLLVGSYAIANTYTAGCGAPPCDYGYRIGCRRP